MGFCDLLPQSHHFRRNAAGVSLRASCGWRGGQQEGQDGSCGPSRQFFSTAGKQGDPARRAAMPVRERCNPAPDFAIPLTFLNAPNLPGNGDRGERQQLHAGSLGVAIVMDTPDAHSDPPATAPPVRWIEARLLQQRISAPLISTAPRSRLPLNLVGAARCILTSRFPCAALA